MKDSFLLADQIKTDSIGLEMIVYHPNENIYVLNETAKLIFEALVERESVSTILEKICNRYEVSFDIAENDIRHCLSELQEKAIIRP